MDLSALRFWDTATNIKFTHLSLQATHVAKSALLLKIKAPTQTVLNETEI